MKRFYNFIMQPTALPYDFDAWKTLPFPEQAKKVCQAWALQGFGAPPFATIFYVLKTVFYVWMAFFFCSFSKELGDFSTVSQWWFHVEALGKVIFWTILIEVIGFGGASGPLTARYLPPLGGFLYFLRPKTVKKPLFPNIPIVGSDSRTLLDVVLYAALLFTLVKVCTAEAITPELVLPVVLLLLVLGVLDTTIYLAARADIYFPMAICFLFPSETGGALKLVFFGIWFWAAFSKLTPNFSSVVCVMICNSPVLKFDWLKKRLFKNYPHDLSISAAAKRMSHFGTVVEFVLPMVLLLSSNPEITLYALVGLTAFHLFIFINLPMGVPLEWNIMMVYGGYVLFLMNPNFAVANISEPIIIVVLGISLVVLPILGNLFPKYISFLLSMRYYAGTWAYSIWLFKGKTIDKIDAHITKTSPALTKQLAFLYDRQTVDAVLSRTIAFRMMHRPGSVLQDLVPKAVDNVHDYVWMDGEFMAGEIIGWNFGEGHLHSEMLLASVQKRCHFEAGELRVIMVESPPFHTQKLAWRIYDAQTGLVERGQLKVVS